MTMLRCATHVVADLDAACARFERWMDYRVVERGVISADLAASWHCPTSAERAYAVLQAASGAEVYLRFVEGDPVADYLPIRSYGWAAIELCVMDVDAVYQRMQASPFEVIGPPRTLDGFATIKPMQVRGPDQEIVYLTEFSGHDPALVLPEAVSFIDRPFIIVHAGRDLTADISWLKNVLGLTLSDPVSIRYTMIERAFRLTEDSRTDLVSARWPDGEIFLEFDAYPPQATQRPRHPGALPPGVAVVSMLHSDLSRMKGHWLTPPTVRQGAIYGGRETGVLLTPEGALLEVIAET